MAEKITEVIILNGLQKIWPDYVLVYYHDHNVMHFTNFHSYSKFHYKLR